MPSPSLAPVVVSRIQNRRGTQDQFNALYPVGYNGIGGYGDPDFPGFDSTSYPNVLMPGELALCTDSRKIFMGNINAEYVQLTTEVGDGIALNPITWVLEPVGVFTPVQRKIIFPALETITLEYRSTPFLDILYSLTDNPSPDWTLPGNNYAKNGTMNITSIDVPAGFASLSDAGTEINNYPARSVSFIAQYEYNILGSKIQILYKHDFPVNLTLNISTIQWLPF